MSGLLDSETISMIRSAVLTQYTRVTDGHTDGQTDGIGVHGRRPHVSHRRDMDGKADREYIVTLFTFLDENKAIGLLPKYVAGSPDNMPSFRLYEGDLNIVMKCYVTCTIRCLGIVQCWPPFVVTSVVYR